MTPNQPTTAQLDALVQHLTPGGRVLRAWPLTGGISAAVTALEAARADGVSTRYVVRQYGPADYEYRPDIADAEYAVLQTVRAAGIPAPQPWLALPAGRLFAGPALVTAFIEGSTALPPLPLPETIQRLAALLARLHHLPLQADVRVNVPRLADFVDADLGPRVFATPDPLGAGALHARLRAADRPTLQHPVALLHGDFWIGNVLWHGTEVAAVIDWEDAMIGDPLFDLATARLELLWAVGETAVEEFTRAYLEYNPIAAGALPWWDLYTALHPALALPGWGLPAADETRMRLQHQQFVESALRRLDEPL